ncbi:hypothetical protein [Pseudomonas sp. NPDC087615]|uniref:hypothetical protein n=1 Tax=Pseudomonas sp. NPDC087615 TaxID=3364443 RepID=UPI003806A6C2
MDTPFLKIFQVTWKVQVLNVLAIYSIFLGLASLASRVFSSKYRSEYPVGLMLAMVLLYVFGCIQQLELGVKVVVFAAIVGGGLGIWSLFTGKQHRYSILRQGGELAILFALALVFSWGAEYWVWDEFSHWGAEAEFLAINHNLPTDKEILEFPNYIPGITLLRYFTEFFLAGSGISSFYLVTWLFSLSAIYCVSYSEFRGKWLTTVVIVFFTYLAFFQSLTLTLLIDPLQSLVFLMALRFSLKNENDSFKIMLLAVISVVLLKHVGLILGMLVLMYYVGMRRFADGVTLKALLPRSLMILVAVLATFLSWEAYVAAYGLKNAFAGPSIMFKGPGIIENFSIGLRHVMTNFFPNAPLLPVAYELPFLSAGIHLWLFICIATCAAIALTYNRYCDRKGFFLTFGFLLSSSALYILFLSYVAITSGWFSDVYSFGRYFMVVFFAAFLLQYFAARDGLSIVRCTLIAVLMIGAASVTAPPLNMFFVSEKRASVPLNEEYRIKADVLKKHAARNARIMYVDGKDSIFGFFMFRLKTLPMRYAPYKFFVNANGVASPEETEQFKDFMCTFDFVYADGAPDDFWKRNGHLFDVTGGHVYKINQGQSGQKGDCAAVLLER